MPLPVGTHSSILIHLGADVNTLYFRGGVFASRVSPLPKNLEKFQRMHGLIYCNASGQQGLSNVLAVWDILPRAPLSTGR